MRYNIFFVLVLILLSALINYKNFSSADEGAEHKKLWNRMTKCFEVLI